MKKSCILLLVLCIQSTNFFGKILILNNDYTKFKTSIFDSNSSIKCFVTEVLDSSKSKYIFIRHYFSNSLDKQKLSENNHYKKVKNNVFDQVSFNSRILRNENLTHNFIVYDTLILIQKSKSYIFTGNRFYIELYQYNNQNQDLPYTSYYYLNKNLTPIGCKDSIKALNTQVNNYNHHLKGHYGNLLIYTKKNETAYFRAAWGSRDAETSYSRILVFKKEMVSAFYVSYCDFESRGFDLLGIDCSLYLWFTKSKKRMKL